MSKQVWTCEKCGTLWKDKEAADKCEAIHQQPIRVTALTWVQLGKNIFNYNARRFPDVVKVEIDPEPGGLCGHDYAFYRLERIGPTPV